MKKRKIKNTFKEWYWVKLNYKKPDGYWVVGHVEEVFVEVEHGVNEKANHKKAKEIAEKRFPGCKIVTVIYC